MAVASNLDGETDKNMCTVGYLHYNKRLIGLYMYSCIAMLATCQGYKNF